MLLQGTAASPDTWQGRGELPSMARLGETLGALSRVTPEPRSRAPFPRFPRS